MKAKLKPQYAELLNDYNLPHDTELVLEEHGKLPMFYRIVSPKIMHGIAVSTGSVEEVNPQ